MTTLELRWLNCSRRETVYCTASYDRSGNYRSEQWASSNDNNNERTTMIIMIHTLGTQVYIPFRAGKLHLGTVHIFLYVLYTSSRKRGIGPSAQSYIRHIDVTRAISLSSADIRMTVFMSFCIRTNSFIVWAVNPRKTSDNLTVRVIPFILSSVLQSNFSLATSIAIHNMHSS